MNQKARRNYTCHRYITADSVERSLFFVGFFHGFERLEIAFQVAVADVHAEDVNAHDDKGQGITEDHVA